MVKESFGTITKQFTLAPVRNRNLSYVFSGPTNILGFSNLSNLSLYYFFLLFLVGCWPTHASGVITPSSSDTMQRAEIWAWAHRWWLEHRTFSGKQYLSRSRLWIRYPDLQNISFALYYSHLFSLLYIYLLFYILENFVKMIAVLLILDKCNLYISQNTKFVKTKDMKIQYDTTPIERYNFRSLYGETSCFSIWN